MSYKLQNSFHNDIRKLAGFEEIRRAYTAGDYTTAIKFLTSLLNDTAWEKANFEQGYSREHLILVRAMCFQQLREFGCVLSDTTEVLRSLKDHQSTSQHLALWLRSLAYESQEEWEESMKDLENLKSLIIGGQKNVVFLSEGIMFSFLSYMAPLFTTSMNNVVTINLNCVLDRLRRITKLVKKEIARRKDASQAFCLIDNGTCAFDELTKKFYYRLLLRRPLHPHVHINVWYSMDLMFSSEMGLFKKEDMRGIKGYSLGIKLLNIDDGDRDVKFDVEVRSMSVELCEWSGLNFTEWAGVQAGGKGGLEFRVVRAGGDVHSDSLGKKRFLYVYPITKMVDGHLENGGGEQELRLVPLVVGPIHIMNCHSCFNSCVNHQLVNGNNVSNPELMSSANDSTLQDSEHHSLQGTSKKKRCSWGMDNYPIHIYRAFFLSNEKCLLIEEIWDVGIPGKVWDSAFVMVQMFKDRILQDPNSFRGKRILDLSTGTGLVGLYLAALIANLPKLGNGENRREHEPKTNVILTDLEHALDLIRSNRALNENLLGSGDEVITKIECLRWGDRSRAKRLGVLDYVVASDVVYEPDLFDSLIQTFVMLCSPGRTKIYLGYKRRGLTVEEENRFFTKLQKKFQMVLLQGLPTIKDESQIYVYELSR